MAKTNWIKTELGKHFQVRPNGVDINRNGKVEGKEVADYDNNGQVDELEWVKFLNAHKAECQRLPGIFKDYYKFKPDSILHKALSIESGLESSTLVAKTYAFMAKVLQDYRKELYNTKRTLLEKHKIEIDLDNLDLKSAEILLSHLRQMLITQTKMRFADKAGFVTAMVKDERYNCMSSTIAIMSIARELGWPVFKVVAPEHTFLRWTNDAGQSFDFESTSGEININYRANYGILGKTIKRKIYLTPQTDNAIASDLYSNRATKQSDDRKKLSDLIRAHSLDPKNLTVKINLCKVYTLRSQLEKATKYCNTALKLDPARGDIYLTRGRLNFFKKNYRRAYKDINNAIVLLRKRERIAEAYFIRGAIHVNTFSPIKARKDFLEAAKIDPNNKEFERSIRVSRHPIHFDVQMRNANDVRTAAGYKCPLWISPFFVAGPHLDIGYNVRTKLFDPSAGFSGKYFISHNSNLNFSLGAGYFLPISDNESSPGKGAFFQYGVGFGYLLSNSTGVGVKVGTQHPFKRPSKPDILSGISISHSFW